MEIKKLLSEVDELLVKGKFVDAAKKYYDEAVQTINEHNHPINGMAAKVASIQDMVNNIKQIHSVKLINQTLLGNTSFSEFNYHYEYHNGAQQSYGEIIKRVWNEDGKIVSEKYFIGAIDQEANKAEKNKSEKKVSVKKAEAKAGDNLVIIEGIGPKIAELLKNEGIETFAKLAKTKAEKIKKILEDAGPRYKMHDPGSWPKQADLAAKGKMDELKVLQDELMAGK
jgi:predicted flap endonuclease-1-like 5' DNA nuclease